MAFYLEGTYIDDAYLRKKILDNDQVSIEKNNSSYKKNEKIFKKIGIEIEDVKYEDLLSILERQFSDDELDEYSALLNLNKTHIIAILYLLHEGRIGIKEVKEILHSTSYRTRGEALVEYLVENEDSDIDIFKALKVECGKMSNYTNPSEISNEKLSSLKDDLEKIKLNDNEVRLPYGAIYYMKKNNDTIGEKVNIQQPGSLSNVIGELKLDAAKNLFGADSFNATYISKFGSLDWKQSFFLNFFKKFIDALNIAHLFYLLSDDYKTFGGYFSIYTKEIYKFNSRNAFDSIAAKMIVNQALEKFKDEYRLKFTERPKISTELLESTIKEEYNRNFSQMTDENTSNDSNNTKHNSDLKFSANVCKTTVFQNTLSSFYIVDESDSDFIKRLFSSYDAKKKSYKKPGFYNNPEELNAILNFDILAKKSSTEDYFQIINFGRTSLTNMISNVADLVKKKTTIKLNIKDPKGYIAAANETLSNLQPENLPSQSVLNTILFYYAKAIISNYLEIVIDDSKKIQEDLFKFSLNDGEKKDLSNDLFNFYKFSSLARYSYESAIEVVDAIKNSRFFQDLVCGDIRSSKLFSEMVDYINNLKSNNDIYKNMVGYAEERTFNTPENLKKYVIKDYFPNIKVHGVECLNLMKPLVIKHGEGGIL